MARQPSSKKPSTKKPAAKKKPASRSRAAKEPREPRAPREPKEPKPVGFLGILRQLEPLFHAMRPVQQAAILKALRDAFDKGEEGFFSRGYRKLPEDTIRAGVYIPAHVVGSRTIDVSVRGACLDVFGVRSFGRPQELLIESMSTKEARARLDSVTTMIRNGVSVPTSESMRDPSSVRNIDAADLVPPDWAEYVHLNAPKISEDNPLSVTFSQMGRLEPPPFLHLTFFAHDHARQESREDFISSLVRTLRFMHGHDPDEDDCDDEFHPGQHVN